MRPARILLAEDDIHARRINTLALRAAGYEVHEALNGPEALRRVFEITPDLIVMDVALPGMSGIEALFIPPLVVVLTARALRDDAEAARAAGCDAYLTKPIDPMLLVEEIGKLLSKRGGGR